jgi:hypothetical protein
MPKILASRGLIIEALSESLGFLNPLIEEIEYYLPPDVILETNSGEIIDIEFPLGRFRPSSSLEEKRGWEEQAWGNLTKTMGNFTLEVSRDLTSFSITCKNDTYEEECKASELLCKRRYSELSLEFVTLFGGIKVDNKNDTRAFVVKDSRFSTTTDANVISMYVKGYGGSETLIQKSVLSAIFS